MFGIDDFFVCFVVGNVMNWDGEYFVEILECYDEVNFCMDVLFNFGGFMYIGIIIFWFEFY